MRTLKYLLVVTLLAAHCFAQTENASYSAPASDEPRLQWIYTVQPFQSGSPFFDFMNSQYVPTLSVWASAAGSATGILFTAGYLDESGKPQSAFALVEVKNGSAFYMWSIGKITLKSVTATPVTMTAASAAWPRN